MCVAPINGNILKDTSKGWLFATCRKVGIYIWKGAKEIIVPRSARQIAGYKVRHNERTATAHRIGTVEFLMKKQQAIIYRPLPQPPLSNPDTDNPHLPQVCRPKGKKMQCIVKKSCACTKVYGGTSYYPLLKSCKDANAHAGLKSAMERECGAC
jgi:hypothetical protein